MATRDATDELLAKVGGPGEFVRRVRETKGAKKLTPALSKFLDEWRRSGANTIGFISNALAYGSALDRRGAAYHKNMIRLIKGGHLRVCEIPGPAPEGTAARRDSPYGDRYYVLAEGACPVEPPSDLRGARRRRRR